MRTLLFIVALLFECFAFAQVPVPRRVEWFGHAASGPFTPANISGLAYEWLGKDLSSAINANGIITGNWNDEIQNVASTQGSLVSTEWAASGGAWFSGGGGLSNTSITLPNTYSMVYVFHPKINSARDELIIGNGSANSGMYVGTGGNLIFQGTTVSSPLADDLNYCVIQTANNGAASGAIYTNGVLSANGTFTGQTIHDFGGSANAHSFQGFIFAVLIYTNKIITAGDIANLQTWSTTTYPTPPITPPWAPSNIKGLVYWLNPTNSLLVTNNTLCTANQQVRTARTVASEVFLTGDGNATPVSGGPFLELSGGPNSQAFFGFTNTFLTEAATTKSWAQTNWYFIVVNDQVDGAASVLIDGGSGHENQGVLHNGAQFYINAGTVLSDAIAWPFNNHHILMTYIFNGNNSEIRTNTVSAKSGAAGAQDMIMTQIMGVSTTWQAQIAELMVYNATAGFDGTSQSVWTVSNYLTNKFKIGPGI